MHVAACVFMFGYVMTDGHRHVPTRGTFPDRNLWLGYRKAELDNEYNNNAELDYQELLTQVGVRPGEELAELVEARGLPLRHDGRAAVKKRRNS